VTLSIGFIIYSALVIFWLGYIVGVCREKKKWWKVFHVIEPDEWLVHKKWADPDIHDEYAEAYLKDELKKDVHLFWRSLILVIALVAFLILVGWSLW